MAVLDMFMSLSYFDKYYQNNGGIFDIDNHYQNTGD